MSYDDFHASLGAQTPSSDLSLPLQALWWEAKGDWHKAHELCQKAESKEGDRVHAFLHRVEGDDANAGYWYERAGSTQFKGTLSEERMDLVRILVRMA